MPRTRRVSISHHPHLVIANANDGLRLFSEHADYMNYLEHLRQMVRDKFLKLHGFCLTESQLRLVLTPMRLPLAKIMQRLHTSHSQRMNKKLNRQGYLFRGRYRSIVFVEDEMASVIRSVHLWPVRAGILRRMESYPYSSHGLYISKNDLFKDMVESADVLGRFSHNLKVAERAFEKYVQSAALEADDFGVKEAAPGVGGFVNIAVESDSGSKPSLQDLIKRAGLLLNLNQVALRGPSRRQDLVVARRLFATAAVLGAKRRVSEVAQFLQRDKAQISRLVSQGMDLLQLDTAFRTLYDALNHETLHRHD